MKDRITVDSCIVEGNRIRVAYHADGDCSEAFAEPEFFAEYNTDVTAVPQSVAILPFLANVLPISWIYDAEISLPSCDRDFYDSIPEFKKGYRQMYPSMEFLGGLTAAKLEKNITGGHGTASFFSGGVDAFDTLIRHASQRPALITLWGSDVPLDDAEGWENVEKHLEEICREFQLEYVTVKTSFRTFLNEEVLSRKVQASKDGWWHGFQHGIGMYCHAAPAAFVKGLEQIYFASSFTAGDKGKVTCASDPSIDNFVRFCGAHMVHDGYEFTRQRKVRNITDYAAASGRKIPLRVCWESRGGGNCCTCEKCWRTVLAIYAENQDPRDYGFRYSDFGLWCWSCVMRLSDDPMLGPLRYQPIQDEMRRKCRKEELPPGVRWFYDGKITNDHRCRMLRRMARKLMNAVLTAADKRGQYDR